MEYLYAHKLNHRALTSYNGQVILNGQARNNLKLKKLTSQSERSRYFVRLMGLLQLRGANTNSC